MEKQNKKFDIIIRLSQKEKENLKEYCNSYDIVISRFVRSLIFNHKGEIELKGSQNNRPPSKTFKWEE
jgi:hypothetical protein